MFSLIICSRNRDISEELKQNISTTIGKYEYEIIVVDNSENSYSIFQAYNIGVEKAKYEYLCFMHEDILYRTESWGNVILKEFKDSKVGMLGVVGGYYVGKYDTYWFDSGCHIGQVYDKNHNLWTWSNENGEADVVVVDGLWMCIRRDLFVKCKLKWDEKTYRGFHFYDMDMSMQVLKSGYRINIVTDLMIQHFSNGKCGRTFWMNCIRFHRKWDDFLPQYASNFNLPPDHKEGYFLTIIGCIKGKISDVIRNWHNNA